MNTGDIHSATKLIGSVNLKEEHINSSGTDFITNNYNKLMNYCRKLTLYNNENAVALLSNVFIGIKNKELNGDWKATHNNVDPIVYTIIKNYANNPVYTQINYDDKNKLKGEDTTIVYSNQDEQEERYNDILDTIVDNNDFTEDISDRVELKHLFETLNNGQYVSDFGRKLIYKTINDPNLMVDSIDKSIYKMLNDYEMELLYEMLQLIIKINKGRDKEYDQVK